jgi:hypothetical protein
MNLLVILACVLGGLVSWLAASRILYARIRPYSEPLSCDPKACGGRANGRSGRHFYKCYRQVRIKTEGTCAWRGYDTAGGAALLACVLGAVWPVVAVLVLLAKAGKAVRWAVTANPPERPAETVARQERELATAKEREVALEAELAEATAAMEAATQPRTEERQ